MHASLPTRAARVATRCAHRSRRVRAARAPTAQLGCWGKCLGDGVLLGSPGLSCEREGARLRRATIFFLFSTPTRVPQGSALHGLSGFHRVIGGGARGLHGPWESFKWTVWTCHQESARHSTHMTRSRNLRKILPFRQISRDLA